MGTVVSHFEGWREYALLDASKVQVLDTSKVPAQAFLGVLGITGLTAYVGLTEIAPVKEGDIDFRKIITLLSKAGYRGDLTLEDDSLGKFDAAGRKKVLQEDVQLLREIIAGMK